MCYDFVMVNLNVPLKHQKSDSKDCSIIAIQMVMEYWNDTISFDELSTLLSDYINEKEIHMEGGAIFLSKRGYETYFGHNDRNVTGDNLVDVTEKDLAKLENALKELSGVSSSFRKRKLELDIEYIKTGGKYSTQAPNLDLIDSNLKNKIPIIVCISQRAWRDDPNNRANHYIVVKGKEGDNYIINDPLPEYTESYKVNQEKLLKAWQACGGYTLVAKYLKSGI